MTMALARLLSQVAFFRHPMQEKCLCQFIKYGGGPEGQGAFENTSLSIGADLLKLSNAVGDTFLTVEGAIKHDINVIGDTFIKWSNEFIKLSDVALKIDTFVIKLTQPTTTGDTALPAAAVEGGPQTDFINLNTSLKILGGDIKLLGSDFLKLDTAPDVAALKFAETAVGDAFSQAGADASNVSEDYEARKRSGGLGSRGECQLTEAE